MDEHTELCIAHQAVRGKKIVEESRLFGYRVDPDNTRHLLALIAVLHDTVMMHADNAKEGHPCACTSQ